MSEQASFWEPTPHLLHWAGKAADTLGEEETTVEETKAQTEPEQEGSELVHRICEACNNMFTTDPRINERRCPKCKKD